MLESLVWARRPRHERAHLVPQERIPETDDTRSLCGRVESGAWAWAYPAGLQCGRCAQVRAARTAPIPTCSHCQEAAPRAIQGFCRACWQYQKQHQGTPRPPWLCWPTAYLRRCEACGRPTWPRARGLCNACYVRWWRALRRQERAAWAG